MKTYTKVVREGELLGPVDYEYNFLQHFSGYCSDERKVEACNRAVEMLRKIEAEPDSFKVRLSHSYVEKEVYSVGMYDGWPFWKPTPALLCSGTLGSEWHFFYDIQGIERKQGVANVGA